MRKTHKDDTEGALDLIERSRHGDGDALADLFSSYSRDVRRALAVRGCREHEIDDLEQESFLRALRKAHKCDADSLAQFRGWILSIVMTTYLNWLRSIAADRRRRLAFAAISQSRLETYLRTYDDHRDAVDVVAIMSKALARLGRSDQDLLLMRYFDGMVPRDIAKSLKLRRNTVNRRLSRAYDSLRDWYTRISNGAV